MLRPETVQKTVYKKWFVCRCKQIELLSSVSIIWTSSFGTCCKIIFLIFFQTLFRTAVSPKYWASNSSNYKSFKIAVNMARARVWWYKSSRIEHSNVWNVIPYNKKPFSKNRFKCLEAFSKWTLKLKTSNCLPEFVYFLECGLQKNFKVFKFYFNYIHGNGSI